MTLKIGDLIGGGLSGAVTGTVAGIGTQVASKLVNALLMSGRSIGGIIPDVTIEEHHTDTLTITDHPIETGASITDHAYSNPAEVTMRAAWSNSNSIVNSIVSGSLLSGSISNANDLYRQLLDLQKLRQPFDLVTGKRTYKNMLIKSLAVTTDKDSENALIVTIILRQVILVQTTSTTVPDASVQTDPSSTGPVQSGGTRQPTQSQSQSALYSLFGGGS